MTLSALILCAFSFSTFASAAPFPLPPFPSDIRAASCTASEVWDGPLLLSRHYASNASVTYRVDADGAITHPTWQAEISVRQNMRRAAEDCVDWEEAVRKIEADAKKGKSAR